MAIPKILKADATCLEAQNSSSTLHQNRISSLLDMDFTANTKAMDPIQQLIQESNTRTRPRSFFSGHATSLPQWTWQEGR
eukprot:12566289-Prorocentrum_lima.AAC.1